MPEFLEKRFNEKARWFLSLFSLAAYVLTKVSVTSMLEESLFQLS